MKTLIKKTAVSQTSSLTDFAKLKLKDRDLKKVKGGSEIIIEDVNNI